jgi:putative ABC transport system permease protein
VIRYFLRAARAQLRTGSSLFLLSLLGVALGVASVVSIQIINLNALGAFRGTMTAVSGRADLTIVGSMPVLPDFVYPEVLATAGVEAAWPLYRLDVALSDGDDRGTVFLELLGVDFFSPLDVPWEGPRVDLAEALGRPGWVAVTPELARERGWAVGSRFWVSMGTRKAELEVGGLSDFQKATPLASPRLAVMDIAQAQSLLGTRGELHEIDVKVAPGADVSGVAAALRGRLGSKAQVLTPEEREQQASDLLSAFRLNLTALSLISLFVGGFLVYSSTQASLVRRRMEFGLLRSLGATHRQVFYLLAGDVVALGTLGVALGMPLGYLAARANVDRVSATVSNLYLLEEIHRLEVPLWFYGMAAAVGVAGAALGAVLPAVELGRKDTRALLAAFDLHERVGRAARGLFVSGVCCAAAVVALYLATTDRWRPAGFLEAFLLVAAIPLVTPFLVQGATSLLRVSSFGIGYGIKGLGKQLQTTPVAIAALAVAVSMVVGVTTMVSSFRETLSVWVDSTIRADIYVSTPSFRRARREAVLGDDVIATLASHPGVVHVDRLRQFFASSGGRRFSLSGIDAGVPVEGRFALLEGDLSEAIPALERGAVLVGEPLARKAGLGLGDALVVAGPDGPISLPIAGIYYDYSSELGSAFVDLATLESLFGPGPIGSVALYLKPGADVDVVVDELKRELRGVPVVLRSNRRLRQEAMSVFDQTFAITRLLRYMSLLIAVCGVALTLVVLARERAAELALYRALGADRSQIFRVYLGKGLGMASAGISLGSVTGIAFALVLIYVVNRAFFGWTIAVNWPVGVLLEQDLVILAASGLAAVYPAILASRTPATELRREDL